MSNPGFYGLTDSEAKAGAQAKIDSALAAIEQAQGLLNFACGELSALEGCIPPWRAAGKLADRIRAFWYRVDNIRKCKRFALDDLHLESLAKRLQAQKLRADAPRRGPPLGGTRS